MKALQRVPLPRAVWLLAALTFLAFALRVTALDARSLWADESVTVSRIQHSWIDLFNNIIYVRGSPMAEAHPPLFFALLKLWSMPAGDSDFSLKLLVVFFGVPAVPLAYVLGRRLVSVRGGLVMAALALTSAGLQWYSQELRHYAASVSLAMLSTYLLCRAILAPRAAGMWLAWVAASLAGVFTHYLNGALLACQLAVLAAAVAVNLARAVKAATRLWPAVYALAAAAAGGIGLLAWPRIQPAAQGALSALASRGLDPLASYAMLLAGGSVFGLNAADPTGGLLTAAVFGLSVLGGVLGVVYLPRVLSAGPASRAARRTALAVALAGPALMLLGVSYLQLLLVAYRYVLVLTPAVYLGLACLVETLARGVPAARRRRAARSTARFTARFTARSTARSTAAASLAALVCALQGYGTLSVFAPGPFWQDDWRSMADYIRNHWLPGDVVLTDSMMTASEALDRYFGRLPATVMQLTELQPPDQATQQLQARYQRIWLLNTGGEALPSIGAGVVQAFPLREQVRFPARTNILELDLLETHSPLAPAVPPGAQAVPPVESQAHLAVAGYRIAPGCPYADRPNAIVSVYWSRGAAGALAGYRLTARLNAEGTDWAALDTPAGLDSSGADWPAGQLYRADYILPLDLGLPALAYTLNLEVHAGSKGEVVQSAAQPVAPETTGQAIRIIAWPGAATGPAVWADGDIALTRAEYAAVVHPGNAIPVALTWQAARPGLPGWDTTLRVSGLLGNLVVTASQATGWGAFPVAGWPAGEPVRSLQTVQLPNTAAPGYYRLSMARRAAGGQPAGEAGLGLVQIADYPVSRLPDQPQVTVTGRAAEISLLGYRLDQPFERGRTIDVYTYWRVDARPAQDGVLFVHLLGPDGKPVAQDDSPPEQGARSTQTYRAGEELRQLHRMTLPPDAQAGVYTLHAGIYNRGDRERWPAEQNGAPAQDNVVVLGQLTLH